MNALLNQSDFVAIPTRSGRNNTLYHAATGSRFAVATDAWHRTGVLTAQLSGDSVKASLWARRSWLAHARPVGIGS